MANVSVATNCQMMLARRVPWRKIRSWNNDHVSSSQHNVLVEMLAFDDLRVVKSEQCAAFTRATDDDRFGGPGNRQKTTGQCYCLKNTDRFLRRDGTRLRNLAGYKNPVALDGFHDNRDRGKLEVFFQTLFDLLFQFRRSSAGRLNILYQRKRDPAVWSDQNLTRHVRLLPDEDLKQIVGLNDIERNCRRFRTFRSLSE